MNNIIFVVEDNDDTRGLLGLVLDSNGFAPKLFETSDQAMQNLHLRPRIIFLDYCLFGSSIPIKKLVSEAKKGGARVVLISGMNKIREKADEIGADAFLAKPFDLNDLLSEAQKSA